MLSPRFSMGLKGIGQTLSASCPSLEQLMGITDPSDPCQSGGLVYAASPAVSLSPSPMTGPTPTLAQVAPTATVQGAGTIAGIPIGTVVLGGAVVFVVAILMGGRR